MNEGWIVVEIRVAGAGHVPDVGWTRSTVTYSYGTTPLEPAFAMRLLKVVEPCLPTAPREEMKAACLVTYPQLTTILKECDFIVKLASNAAGKLPVVIPVVVPPKV
jgi:hypothetical protein